VATVTAVHDPRSPCEGSQGGVHPVVLVGILQETLIDGILVPTRKSFTGPSWPITTGREVFRARGLCVGPKPQALGKPVGQKRAQRRVPDSRMKADGAGDPCPDPPLGGLGGPGGLGGAD